MVWTGTRVDRDVLAVGGFDGAAYDRGPHHPTGTGGTGGTGDAFAPTRPLPHTHAPDGGRPAPSGAGWAAVGAGEGPRDHGVPTRQGTGGTTVSGPGTTVSPVPTHARQVPRVPPADAGWRCQRCERLYSACFCAAEVESMRRQLARIAELHDGCHIWHCPEKQRLAAVTRRPH